MPDTNPLLQRWTLPPWSALQIGHLLAGIQAIIADNERVIAQVVASQTETPNWDDLVLAVDETDARLDEALAVIETLAMAKPDDSEWRQTTDLCEAAVLQYQTGRLNNPALYLAYQNLADSPIARNFDEARKAALNKALLTFRLAGVDLPVKQQQALSQLNSEILRLEKLFLENLERASALWAKPIHDEALLAGLRPAAKNRLAGLASRAGLDGWLLPLDNNTYRQVMTFAESRALREEYFIAYSTRASDQGPHADTFDNGPVLAALLDLRQQEAELLGFNNYVELRLETETVKSTAQLEDFLYQRITSIAPVIEQDVDALETFAREQGLEEVQAWDQDFLAEKLRARQSNGALSDLRDYFALDGTLRRLCLFCERMFGIRIIEQVGNQHWHESVRLFEITEHGQTSGYIYLVPFHLKETPDFAWTVSLRNRRINAEGRPSLPIAVLYSNFTPTTADQPCLLEHRDLRVLFHEFGHCLQQVLTRSPHHTLSDIVDLGFDSAEFTGQLFEHWCFSKDFLLWLGAHHQTGALLAGARVDKALDALQTQVSAKIAHQLMGALLDFELHRRQGDGRSIQQVFDDVQGKIPRMKLPAYCRFANGFDYLATGYEAAVYAYSWSGALAKEAFERFRRDGVFNRQTGRDLREAIFSPGDSRPLPVSLKAFLNPPVS